MLYRRGVGSNQYMDKEGSYTAEKAEEAKRIAGKRETYGKMSAPRTIGSAYEAYGDLVNARVDLFNKTMSRKQDLEGYQEALDGVSRAQDNLLSQTPDKIGVAAIFASKREALNSITGNRNLQDSNSVDVIKSALAGEYLEEEDIDNAVRDLCGSVVSNDKYDVPMYVAAMGYASNKPLNEQAKAIEKLRASASRAASRSILGN